MSSTEKIAPCPFCGKPAELRGGKGIHWVQCSDMDFCDTEGMKSKTRAAAINHWNRRPEGPTEEQQRAAPVATPFDADPGEVERLQGLMAQQAEVEACYEHAQKAMEGETSRLRTQLAEAHALLREAACHATRMEPMSASCLNRIDAHLDASAEPSAPVERDERADFERHYASKNDGFVPPFFDGEYDWHDAQPCWESWQARAALERKP